ncbi:MAG: YigZ family protein [Candidatus Cloacimonetes bacterium]|nr:YigZ family protein [Candidatus Cloacimonadota bacterium]
MDYFYSVDSPRVTEIKIKRSRFICHLAAVSTLDAAKAEIATVAAEHKTANHNCWAYIVGDAAEMFHSSDAGEPGGTAGKPMLNVLKKNNMTNIVAVVTRYFGGVKLGVRGLIEAYGESVQSAVDAAPLKKLVHYTRYQISLGYDMAEIIKYTTQKLHGEIEDVVYGADVCLKIKVETHIKNELENYLQEMDGAGKLTLLE